MWWSAHDLIPDSLLANYLFAFLLLAVTGWCWWGTRPPRDLRAWALKRGLNPDDPLTVWDRVSWRRAVCTILMIAFGLLAIGFMIRAKTIPLRQAMRERRHQAELRSREHRLAEFEKAVREWQEQRRKEEAAARALQPPPAPAPAVPDAAPKTSPQTSPPSAPSPAPPAAIPPKEPRSPP